VVREFFKSQWTVLGLCCVLGAWLVMIAVMAYTPDQSKASGTVVHNLALVFFGPIAFFPYPSLWFLLYVGYGMLNAFAQYELLIVVLALHNIAWLIVVIFPETMPFVLAQKQMSFSHSFSDAMLYYVGNCVVYVAVMALLLFNVFYGIKSQRPKA
jgi:hypothetical protein